MFLYGNQNKLEKKEHNKIIYRIHLFFSHFFVGFFVFVFFAFSTVCVGGRLLKGYGGRHISF
jgi:hypothetical protein